MSRANLSRLGLDRGFGLLWVTSIGAVAVLAFTAHLALPLALLIVLAISIVQLAGMMVMSL